MREAKEKLEKQLNDPNAAIEQNPSIGESNKLQGRCGTVFPAAYNFKQHSKFSERGLNNSLEVTYVDEMMKAFDELIDVQEDALSKTTSQFELDLIALPKHKENHLDSMWRMFEMLQGRTEIDQFLLVGKFLHDMGRRAYKKYVDVKLTSVVSMETFKQHLDKLGTKVAKLSALRDRWC